MSTYIKKNHNTLTASGEVNPSGQPDRFFPVFFRRLPFKGSSKKTGGQGGRHDGGHGGRQVGKQGG